MRAFVGGNNLDTTAAVKSYLSDAKQVYLADLVLIGEVEDPLAEFLTNWESALSWPNWGTFNPAVITRGKITSQVGLQVDSLDFSWSPPLTAFGTTLATANAYQKGQTGFYDNRTFRMWRTIMPTPGDANTYGACQLFGGRIATTTVTRGNITFTVNSFLDVINQQVPPNVIELTNTLANFAGNTPVVSDNETIIAQFTVVDPSSTTDILAVCTAPNPGKIYGINKFQYGFLVFNQGSSLAGYWSPVSASQDYHTRFGVHYNEFFVYQGFPWAPEPGDSFYVSTQPPINLQDAAAGFAYFGFPYVPQPESAL
jgi:hypothetical protein